MKSMYYRSKAEIYHTLAQNAPSAVCRCSHAEDVNNGCRLRRDENAERVLKNSRTHMYRNSASLLSSSVHDVARLSVHVHSSYI